MMKSFYRHILLILIAVIIDIECGVLLWKMHIPASANSRFSCHWTLSLKIRQWKNLQILCYLFTAPIWKSHGVTLTKKVGRPKQSRHLFQLLSSGKTWLCQWGDIKAGKSTNYNECFFLLLFLTIIGKNARGRIINFLASNLCGAL